VPAFAVLGIEAQNGVQPVRSARHLLQALLECLEPLISVGRRTRQVIEFFETGGHGRQMSVEP